MNPCSEIEFIDSFNIEDLVNSQIIRELIVDPYLGGRLITDFSEEGLENLTYKKLIDFYNGSLLRHVKISSSGVLSDIENIIKECKFELTDEESSYFKSLSNILILKSLSNTLSITHKIIRDKIKEAMRRLEVCDSMFSKIIRQNIQTIFSSPKRTKDVGRPFSANHNSLRRQSVNTVESKNRMSFGKENKWEWTENEDDTIKYESKDCRKSNLNLTSAVWPKSRTLLSIISKMYKENIINAEQRFALKEMVIDRDSNLYKILVSYEVTGDSNKMYQNILKLSKQS